MRSIIIVFSLILSLSACSQISENKGNEEALYASFLSNEVASFDERDRSEIWLSDILRLKPNAYYKFVDINNDGVEELHISSDRFYYVFTVVDNQIKYLCNFSGQTILLADYSFFAKYYGNDYVLYSHYIISKHNEVENIIFFATDHGTTESKLYSIGHQLVDETTFLTETEPYREFINNSKTESNWDGWKEITYSN